jgi:hypothetical protein
MKHAGARPKPIQVSLAISSQAHTKALETTESMTMAAVHLSGGPDAKQDSVP